MGERKFAVASGIYQIENQVHGKRYIGSAVNFRKRWRNHLSALRLGQHRNRHLQRAFAKYGEEAFVFSVLEDVEEPEKLIEREQRYLNTLNPEYNILPTAGSPLGHRHTDETRAKISATHKGKYPSAKTRAKMSAATTGERNSNYGKHLSDATRRKISNALMGRHLSDETCARMREAHKSVNLSGERNPFYGKHHSAETKRKISITQKARWRRIRALKSASLDSPSIKQSRQK